MGKLSDILNGHGGDFNVRWDTTEAARDFAPVPRGVYECDLIAGELESSRTKSTPGYRLTFSIHEGEFAKRLVWHDLWLTPAALPMAKRDLARIGITSPEQMERPIPRGIVCKVRVALRTDDDGTQRNVVKSFVVVRIDPPEADPFAPNPKSETAPKSNGTRSKSSVGRVLKRPESDAN